MPVKWKIFLVLNFILMVPALFCLCLLVINLFNERYRHSNEEVVFETIAFISLLTITLNGLLNVYLLQRFYPDKLLPVGVRRLNVISLVLNILISIGIMILCIYAATYEFGEIEEDKDTAGRIILAIFCFFWIVQVVVLVIQGRLPIIINRNHRGKMDSLIDSIGQ